MTVHDEVSISRFALSIALAVCESVLEESHFDDVAAAVVEMKEALGEFDESF